jgi:tyrosyl-tRNA synthetase
MDRTEVVFNSSWFDKMSVLELLKLTMHATVAQMLARADFKKRMTQQQDISILEFIYPLLQGYDSVELKADVELGGTDQIFNLLFGRAIQKDFGQDPQVVITMPLLEGTDGVQKMSKSYGNYVGISESAKAIFGKIMSISDEMMLKYFTLLTDISLTDIATMHPKDAKVQLAWNIVAQYYGAADADAARQEFERVFSQKEIPEDIAVYALHAPTPIIDLLVNANLVTSKNEARRLIEQGGVSLDGTPISQEDSLISTPGILKVGKRRFLKLQ